MIELSKEECEALEKTIIDRIAKSFEDNQFDSKLYLIMSKIAVRSTIATIREYERIKSNKDSH